MRPISFEDMGGTAASLQTLLHRKPHERGPKRPLVLPPSFEPAPAVRIKLVKDLLRRLLVIAWRNPSDKDRERELGEIIWRPIP
jgi:hypothetical protein